MILGQYSIIGYLTALFCVLMSTIDVIMLGEWRLGPITCNIWYAVDPLLNTTSAWLSTVVMMERLLCIEAPQFYLNLSQRCKAMVVLCPWALSLLATSLNVGFLQHGKFYNFVSQNGTSLDQCYLVDPDNASAIYSTTGSFLLPYTATLCLFVTIKYKAAFTQTRFALSKSVGSLSDVLLDSDPDEGINNPPRLSEHNYTSTPEDTLRREDFTTGACHLNRQPQDVCRKYSPDGQSFFSAMDITSKTGISFQGNHTNSTKRPPKTRQWTHSPTSRTRVIQYPHETYGANCSSETSNFVAKEPKPQFPRKIVSGNNKHLNGPRDGRQRPLPYPVNRHLRARRLLDKSPSPSAYVTNLQKAKRHRSANRSFEEMSSNEATPSKHNHRHHRPQMDHSSSSYNTLCAERMERIYVNTKCVGAAAVAAADESPRRAANNVRVKQGEAAGPRAADAADASSSDSESSHGLISRRDKTAAKPRKEHIVMTNILEAEHLRTVHHAALVVFLYSLFWLPFYIMRLLLRFAPQITIYHNVYSGVHLLGYFSSGVCPWMYYLLHGYIKSSTWSSMKYRLINPSHSDLSSTSSV